MAAEQNIIKINVSISLPRKFTGILQQADKVIAMSILWQYALACYRMQPACQHIKQRFIHLLKFIALAPGSA